GTPGHWLARELYLMLGSSVYVLLVAWFTVVLMLLVRKSWLRWTRRFMGWMLFLPCSAIAADYLGNEWLPGSGGALGAFLRELLQEQLPHGSAIVVFAGVSFIAVFLAADFVLRIALDIFYGICFALS